MDAATPFPPSVSSQGWIGGYHLLHKIGTGGTGTVWEAVDEGGNKVALKLLHPSVADTEDARKRLLREARLVNQIKSDNISQVLDVEADAFAPFVVTELIAGQTLDKVVANAPASAEELHELAIDLADVLDDVHEANVAHRDLKPSNIVMSPDGPVLIDFGIAQSSDDGRITQTGSVTGTPGYVAPEILRDASQPTIDQWQDGDWFAWAAVLLSASTGRPPFGTGSADGILHRLFSGEPDTQGLSPHLDRAFKLALSPEPALRVTPDTLIAALEEQSLADQYPADQYPADQYEDTRTLPPDPSHRVLLGPEVFDQAPVDAGEREGRGDLVQNHAQDPDGSGPLGPGQIPPQVPGQTPFQELWQQPAAYRHPFARPATLLSVLLLAVLGWIPAVAGIGWILPGAAVLLLAQAIGRAEVQISTRRNSFGGPRKSDGPVAALSVPWTFTTAFVAMLPGYAVGAIAFLLVWMVASLGTSAAMGVPFEVESLTYWFPQSGVEAPYPWHVGPYPWCVGAASVGALFAAWAMPTSRWARIGLARIFSWIAPTTGLRWVWATLLVVAFGFLVVL